MLTRFLKYMKTRMTLFPLLFKEIPAMLTTLISTINRFYYSLINPAGEMNINKFIVLLQI